MTSARPLPRARLAGLTVSLAFALTGVGTAMLGAALPAMLAEWRLDDRSGGLLLLSAFAGSTLGAAFLHRPHRLVPALGLLLCSAATALLLYRGAALAKPGCFLYGFGLGITMTSISLLRSQAVGAAQNQHEMNRLNLLWALGACCAPALAFRSLERVSVDHLLRMASLVLLLVAAGLAVAAERTPRRSAGEPNSTRPTAEWEGEPWAPLHLCLFAGAAVALETAIGSWLTTFTERQAHPLGVAVSATAAFWLGLLLGRLVHSVAAGRALQARRGVLLHLVLVAVAALLLVAVPGEITLLVAAFFAGWGLGPLYPLALSLALPRFRSGGVFVAAGLGASLLPWFTGALSSALHSLRAGMLAPCGAVCVLLLTAVRLWPEIPESAQVPR